MPRITCRTPSTGKPLRISLANVSANYVTIAEAIDFSVPDPSNKFPDRDPVDDSRAIRPGEIFFLSPLAAKNKSNTTAWIETRLYAEGNVIIELGRVDVPANDTVFIPVQGRSLFKRDPSSNTANGDMLQVKAQFANTFDVWAAAEEKLSSEHSGIIE
jgi:hypothetical protein